MRLLKRSAEPVQADDSVVHPSEKAVMESELGFVVASHGDHARLHCQALGRLDRLTRRPRIKHSELLMSQDSLMHRVQPAA